MLTALQARHNLPLTQPEIESYVREEEDRVIALLKKEAQPCECVNEVLEKLYKEKKYGLAVVSSSALRRVQASLVKVNQDQYFPPDHIFSAATSLPTPTSKPDPAVYIHACKVIGKSPQQCVAVEDSKSGTLSAVRAGIRVIGYVGAYEEEKVEEMEKVLRDAGAQIVIRHFRDFEKALEDI